MEGNLDRRAAGNQSFQPAFAYDGALMFVR